MNIKRIVAESPEKITLQTKNEPLEINGADEVLVQNKVSHISTGTELACLAGLEDWFKMPSTPGYTAIGKVVAKGSNVSHINEGDLVYTFGPHAAYFKVDTKDRWHGICTKVPQGINPHHAVFAHMAGIAITAIRKSKIELGDDVAVVGMGAIGNLAAQLAQLQGANVVVMDINDKRLDIARHCGLENTIKTKTGGMAAAIKEATEGRGVTTFIDATGVPAVINEAASCINRYGELILLGSPRAPYNTNLTPFLQHIHLWSHGAIEVKGALEFTLPTHQTEFVKHSIERNSEIILRLINSGKLLIAPLISHVLTPEQAAYAYNGLRENPNEFIGVVFDWTS